MNCIYFDPWVKLLNYNSACSIDFRVPYNVKTVVGHVFTHFAEFLGVSSLVAVLCTLCALFYGVCEYSQSFLSDLAPHFDSIDQKLKTKRVRAAEIRLCLIQIVEFHNSIYRFQRVIFLISSYKIKLRNKIFSYSF